MEQTSLPNRSGRPPTVVNGSEKLAQEIAHLPTLDLPAVRKKWTALFGAHPPPHLGRVMMVRAIAYRLQERALSALKPATLRILDRVCDGRAEIALGQTAKGRAGAGTVLIREWRGGSHRGTVLDNDVVYRGRRYKSLSEVARAITGTRWSGPLFFGLKGRAKEVARG